MSFLRFRVFDNPKKSRRLYRIVTLHLSKESWF